MSDPSPLVEVRALRIAVGGRTPVDGVDLTVRAGERWGLVGESGSGKSLTASAIAALPPRAARLEGRLSVAGTDVVTAAERDLAVLRGRSVTMLLQDSAVALNPLVRIGTQVALPLRGRRRAQARAEVRELLAAVGFDDPEVVARARPAELSGGQRQRVGLATALAGRPALLVADEPTTALDPVVTRDVLGLLDRRLRPRGDHHPALLLVSHDLAVVAGLCTHLAVMHRGRIVEQGTTDAVLGDARAAHTRDLLDAARLLTPAGAAP